MQLSLKHKGVSTTQLVQAGLWFQFLGFHIELNRNINPKICWRVGKDLLDVPDTQWWWRTKMEHENEL